MFKKRRGINVPYNRQGLIYFICMNEGEMPQAVREKIRRLCEKIGGEYCDALFALLTDDRKNIHGVAMDFHVSETLLYQLRKKFYEEW